VSASSHAEERGRKGKQFRRTNQKESQRRKREPSIEGGGQPGSKGGKTNIGKKQTTKKQKKKKKKKKQKEKQKEKKKKNL